MRASFLGFMWALLGRPAPAAVEYNLLVVRRLPVIQTPPSEDAEAQARSPWQWVLIGAGFTITFWLPLATLAAWLQSRPLIVLSYTLLFSMPLMLALTFPFFAELKAASLAPAVWAAIFWALVVCSFVGWLLWTWVNSVRGVARSAPFMYLMPPVAGVMAWLTLGEIFTWLKVLGAGVTMAGVAWAQFGGGKPPSKETGQPDAA